MHFVFIFFNLNDMIIHTMVEQHFQINKIELIHKISIKKSLRSFLNHFHNVVFTSDYQLLIFSYFFNFFFVAVRILSQ